MPRRLMWELKIAREGRVWGRGEGVQISSWLKNTALGVILRLMCSAAGSMPSFGKWKEPFINLKFDGFC